MFPGLTATWLRLTVVEYGLLLFPGSQLERHPRSLTHILDI